MGDHTYPQGIDCAWLAVDRDNLLGVFITGGCGPVPLQTLTYLATLDPEELALALPVVSGCRLLAPLPDPNSFAALAARGFFVFDWSDIHRPHQLELRAYEAVAIPSSPITIDTLPPDLASLAGSVRFAQKGFADTLLIDVRSYFDCIDGEHHIG